MPISIDQFGDMLPQWQEENKTPWGRLRYHLTWKNIARHVGDQALRILDIGGGNGMDAIHYATMGHAVILTDCSPTMLAEAQRSAEEQGVAERLRFYQTGPEAIPDLSRERPFDLILCHMMIEFVPDAQALLGNACKLLAPKGLLSILDTNRYSDVYMQTFQVNSLSNALQVIGRKEYLHPWVNRPTPRFSADQIIAQLGWLGCSLVGHYGVLNVCAFLPNEPKFDPKYYAELERLEERLAGTYPYYLLARFFHLIVQKAE